MGRTPWFLALVLVLVQGSPQDSWVDYIQDGILRLVDSTQRHKRESPKQPPNALITFEDCGEEGDPIVVNYVSVEPNPVVFPGDMQIKFGIHVRENKTSPIKAEMTMSKKISLLFGLTSWFNIPCLGHGIGSCDFDDLCEHPVILEGLCRELENGIVEDTCGCPFIQGNYTSKQVKYNVPKFPEDVPAYLLRGEFLVKAVLFKDGQQLCCYQASFFLEV